MRAAGLCALGRTRLHGTRSSSSRRSTAIRKRKVAERQAGSQTDLFSMCAQLLLLMLFDVFGGGQATSSEMYI